MRDVVLPPEISEGRAASRRELRASLDRMKRFTDKLAEDPAVTFDQFYQQGVDLVLVAAGARRPSTFTARTRRCATLTAETISASACCSRGGWSRWASPWSRSTTAAGIITRSSSRPTRASTSKKLDQGVAALITDLDQRGLLDTTLVLLLGEFGRTPKVNKDAGRDHWPHAMSVLMAGAGIPRGQVVGATDAKGYYASENVYRPEDFAASLYTKMGIDPNAGAAHEHGPARPTREQRAADQGAVCVAMRSVPHSTTETFCPASATARASGSIH